VVLALTHQQDLGSHHLGQSQLELLHQLFKLQVLDQIPQCLEAQVRQQANPLEVCLVLPLPHLELHNLQQDLEHLQLTLALEVLISKVINSSK
jgi:hypothetical protein